MSRSLRSALALQAVVLGVAAALPATAARAQDPAVGRAVDAYTAMQKQLYIRHSRMYQGPHFAKVWGFSQALAATVSVSRLPGAGPRFAPDLRDRLLGLDRYWAAPRQPPGYTAEVQPPLGPGGHLFYDDNDWIGIELARLYLTDHQPYELTRARQIFTLEVSGWSNDASLPCPGGVPWTDNPDITQRNTISNAPAAELGVQLYTITHDPTFLFWAKRMYGWVRDCLSLGNGLYADHIDASGTVDSTAWTYTQGVMIGAATLLYQATGDRSYLDQAQAVEQAAFGYFAPNQFVDEPLFFVSILFRNLLLYNNVRPDPRITQLVQSYANWAATKRKKNGLYRFADDESRLLEQAAVINIDALLVEPASSFY